MPPLSDSAVFIAVFTAVATLIGGGFATYQQLRKDRRQAAVDNGRLEQEIRAALMLDLKEWMDELGRRLDVQDATIEKLRTRVQQLEEENARLRDENEALRQRRKRL
jgi:cell division protein FtsB